MCSNAGVRRWLREKIDTTEGLDITTSFWMLTGINNSLFRATGVFKYQVWTLGDSLIP